MVRVEVVAVVEVRAMAAVVEVMVKEKVAVGKAVEAARGSVEAAAAAVAVAVVKVATLEEVASAREMVVAAVTVTAMDMLRAAWRRWASGLPSAKRENRETFFGETWRNVKTCEHSSAKCRAKMGFGSRIDSGILGVLSSVLVL